MEKTQINLDEEFIPYKQALALKELGFNEPCFGLFNNIEPNELYELHSHSTSTNTGKLILAPLYQQAFRWFREKYDLDSFIKHIYKSTIKVGYYFGIDEYKGVEFQMDFDVWYNTYEEAELECLKKLIHIVKNK